MAGKSASDRDRQADKRRVYAGFLASVVSATAAVINLDSYGESRKDSQGWKDLVDKADAAVAAMVDAVSEVWLIAPDHLAQQADDAARTLEAHRTKIEVGQESDLSYYRLRHDLYQAMRADLHEPVTRKQNLDATQATDATRTT